MTRKLTLTVDNAVIQKAKRYASTHKRSLSEIVTNYLEFLTQNETTKDDIDPMILEISDNIKIDDIPNINDPKFNYLKKKYIHE